MDFMNNFMKYLSLLFVSFSIYANKINEDFLKLVNLDEKTFVDQICTNRFEKYCVEDKVRLLTKIKEDGSHAYIGMAQMLQKTDSCASIDLLICSEKVLNYLKISAFCAYHFRKSIEQNHAMHSYFSNMDRGVDSNANNIEGSFNMLINMPNLLSQSDNVDNSIIVLSRFIKQIEDKLSIILKSKGSDIIVSFSDFTNNVIKH